MRVDIKHHEFTTGMIFKKQHFGVDLDLIFSEEEKVIIKHGSLDDTIVMHRTAPSIVGGNNEWNLTIGKLLYKEPDRMSFETSAEAQMYDQKLKEALTQLKQYLNANGQKAENSSFEL